METELDFLETASKEVVHKTGEFLGNKTADAITNSYDTEIAKIKPVIDENSRSIMKIKQQKSY